jgi:membrane protein implicated in regulation of membrane protease activity
MTRREIGEAVFTILAICSLWPAILGWDHPLYQVVLVAVLAVLVILVVHKFRRIRQMHEETKLEAKKRRRD